jgi:hypothetical protein
VAFREKLPDGCPPDAAHDGGCPDAYRLVSSAKLTVADFASNAAKQQPLPPNVDPCRWASYSFYADMDTVHKKRKAFKKLREFTYVAKVEIAAGSGCVLIDGTHIDFWMFETFDPTAAIVHVEGL